MENLEFNKIEQLENELLVVKLRNALKLARNALENARQGAAIGAPFSVQSFDMVLALVDCNTPPVEKKR